MDGGGDGYPKTVGDYVHLNPVRARLLAAAELLQAYLWSSFPEYLKPTSRRVTGLRVDRLFGEYRILKDGTLGRRVVEAVMEARREQEDGESFEGVRRALVPGRERFRQELLAQVDRQLGALHFGVERTESRAARLVQEEPKRLRWTEADLAARRKGDLNRVRQAQRLRETTLVTLAWIAKRLQMGSATCLNHRLYLPRKGRSN